MINIASANEHAPYIERLIRDVKERTRAVRHSLPFNETPKILAIYVVFTIVRIINYLPVKGGVSTILSPKTIIHGEEIHYKQHLRLNIG